MKWVLAATFLTILSGCGGGGSNSIIQPPAILGFTSSQAYLAPGQTVILIPSFTNGTGSLDQGIGPVVSEQSVTVSPLTTTTYTLTVTNSTGVEVTRTLTLGATAPFLAGGNRTNLDGTSPEPGYWRSGTWIGFPGTVGSVYALTVIGGDVYAAGNSQEFSGWEPCLWINGASNALPVLDPSLGGIATCVANGGGNIYIGGCQYTPSGESHPGYWQNGVWADLALPSSMQALGYVGAAAVDGADVYFAGGGGSNVTGGGRIPGFWKNGQWSALSLPPGVTNGTVNALVVAGGHLYAGGQAGAIPGIWQDGTWTALPVLNVRGSSGVASIAVSPTQVVAVGSNSDLNNGVTFEPPGAWVNGTWSTFNSANFSTQYNFFGSAAAFLGQDLYIAGDCDEFGTSLPGLWVNGTWVPLVTLVPGASARPGSVYALTFP